MPLWPILRNLELAFLHWIHWITFFIELLVHDNWLCFSAQKVFWCWGQVGGLWAFAFFKELFYAVQFARIVRILTKGIKYCCIATSQPHAGCFSSVLHKLWGERMILFSFAADHRQTNICAGLCRSEWSPFLSLPPNFLSHCTAHQSTDHPLRACYPLSCWKIRAFPISACGLGTHQLLSSLEKSARQWVWVFIYFMQTTR